MNEQTFSEDTGVVTTLRGPFIQTFKENHFYANDPQPDDIDIEDIAHSLSMKCRFNGHVPRFYSVAEHSVLVASRMSPENALWGLLHDAAEAYMPDMPRPFKSHFPNYDEIENKILKVIIEKFGLSFPVPDEVVQFDKHVVASEANFIWGKELEWTKSYEKHDVKLACLSPESARFFFLDAFADLVGL